MDRNTAPVCWRASLAGSTCQASTTDLSAPCTAAGQTGSPAAELRSSLSARTASRSHGKPAPYPPESTARRSPKPGEGRQWPQQGVRQMCWWETRRPWWSELAPQKSERHGGRRASTLTRPPSRLCEHNTGPMCSYGAVRALFGCSLVQVSQSRYTYPVWISKIKHPTTDKNRRHLFGKV